MKNRWVILSNECQSACINLVYFYHCFSFARYGWILFVCFYLHIKNSFNLNEPESCEVQHLHKYKKHISSFVGCRRSSLQFCSIVISY